MKNRMLKLGLISICSFFLTACETCPNAIQYGQIGIKYTPGACAKKDADKEATPPGKETPQNEDANLD